MELTRGAPLGEGRGPGAGGSRRLADERVAIWPVESSGSRVGAARGLAGNFQNTAAWGVNQSCRLAAEKLNKGAPLGEGQGGGHAGWLLSLVVAALVRPGVLQVTWLLRAVISHAGWLLRS